MKRTLLILLMIMTTLALCGCDSSDSVESSESTMMPTNTATLPLSPMEQHYIDYLEAAKISRAYAVVDYCHFEDEVHWGMAVRSGNLVTDYEIRSIERIGDQLWRINAKIYSLDFPDGLVVDNYVGYILDGYYVMTSQKQIPENLKIGTELESDED